MNIRVTPMEQNSASEKKVITHLTLKEQIKVAEFIKPILKPVGNGSDLFIYTDDWTDEKVAAAVGVPNCTVPKVQRVRLEVYGNLYNTTRVSGDYPRRTQKLEEGMAALTAINETVLERVRTMEKRVTALPNYAELSQRCTQLETLVREMRVEIDRHRLKLKMG
jgi:hypothetical protein